MPQHISIALALVLCLSSFESTVSVSRAEPHIHFPGWTPAWSACSSTRCLLAVDQLWHQKQSVDYCRNKGLDAASITTPEDLTLLSKSLWDGVWIGLSSQSPDIAQFRWKDGSGLAYTNWRASGEPYLKRNETCVLAQQSPCPQLQTRAGGWTTSDCSNRHPSLCELGPGVSADFCDISVALPSGMVYCLILSIRATWQESAALCEEGQGMLASVRTVEEQHILSNLLGAMSRPAPLANHWLLKLNLSVTKLVNMDCGTIEGGATPCYNERVDGATHCMWYNQFSGNVSMSGCTNRANPLCVEGTSRGVAFAMNGTYGDDVYQFVPMLATFEEACQACSRIGYSLAVALTEAEHWWMVASAAKHMRNQPYWVGVRGDGFAAEGTGVATLWRGFSAVSPEEWRNQSGCMAVGGWDEESLHWWPGVWWPGPCDQKWSFVCKKGPPPHLGGGTPIVTVVPMAPQPKQKSLAAVVGAAVAGAFVLTCAAAAAYAYCRRRRGVPDKQLYVKPSGSPLWVWLISKPYGRTVTSQPDDESACIPASTCATHPPLSTTTGGSLPSSSATPPSSTVVNSSGSSDTPGSSNGSGSGSGSLPNSSGQSNATSAASLAAAAARDGSRDAPSTGAELPAESQEGVEPVPYTAAGGSTLVFSAVWRARKAAGASPPEGDDVVVVLDSDPVQPGVDLDLRLGQGVLVCYDQVLGRGSSGAVYRGEYCGRAVAVKILDLQNREAANAKAAEADADIEAGAAAGVFDFVGEGTAPTISTTFASWHEQLQSLDSVGNTSSAGSPHGGANASGARRGSGGSSSATSRRGSADGVRHGSGSGSSASSAGEGDVHTLHRSGAAAAAAASAAAAGIDSLPGSPKTPPTRLQHSRLSPFAHPPPASAMPTPAASSPTSSPNTSITFSAPTPSLSTPSPLPPFASPPPDAFPLSITLSPPRPLAARHLNRSNTLSSLQQEITILSRVHHPNIIRLYGAGLHPPSAFLVMDLMDWNLGTYVRRSGRLPLAEALCVVREVAKGLWHLHPTIMHRDLKPENILLDSTGTVRIGDFGMSRCKIGTLLFTDHLVAGTLPYIAPECYTGQAASEKADIFSLGIILWHCITGRKPWAGWNSVAIMYQVGHMHQRPPLPQDLEVCPPQVASLITSCWAPDPRDRPPATEVVRRCSELLAVLPPSQLPSLP